jgi:hypothetical protein
MTWLVENPVDRSSHEVSQDPARSCIGTVRTARQAFLALLTVLHYLVRRFIYNPLTTASAAAAKAFVAPRLYTEYRKGV